MTLTVARAETPQTQARTLRTVRIALAGCGVVGGELVRLIHRQAGAIAASHGVRLEIASVLVRDVARPRAVPIPASVFTADAGRFLECDADVVVEAIGGVTPADRIARAALGRGASLVTANKALLAECGEELRQLARTRGGKLEFEAAVGGGIPVVRALRRSLRNAPVRSVQAILNGTSNYILTRIEQGTSYAAALVDAQHRGYAEADPSRDLNGTDSADKLRVLAWLAYGVAPGDLAVTCHGLLPDPEALVRTAAALGKCVRLVATCERTESGELRASVAPQLVARDSVFARTVDEQNVVVVDFGWSQPIVLSGPGAGGLPTASALLGDVLCC